MRCCIGSIKINKYDARREMGHAAQEPWSHRLMECAERGIPD